jgi:hypothetical protein
MVNPNNPIEIDAALWVGCILRHMTLKKTPFENERKYWSLDSMNCTGGANNRRSFSNRYAREDWPYQSSADSFESLDATDFMPVGATRNYYYAIERE